jgi:hypothetical protein
MAAPTVIPEQVVRMGAEGVYPHQDLTTTLERKGHRLHKITPSVVSMSAAGLYHCRPDTGESPESGLSASEMTARESYFFLYSSGDPSKRFTLMG